MCWLGKIVIAATVAITQQAHADDNLLCLQRNIYWEARNQSILGQTLVARTTLNRVHDTRWPDTICAVVYQPYQFSWTLDPNKKWSGPAAGEKAEWKLAGLVARQTLLDLALDEPDPSAGATYFHAHYVSPSWAKHRTRTTQHGAHIFYK